MRRQENLPIPGFNWKSISYETTTLISIYFTAISSMQLCDEGFVSAPILFIIKLLTTYVHALFDNKIINFVRRCVVISLFIELLLSSKVVHWNVGKSVAKFKNLLDMN